ncbi:MAG: hypothetical protein ACR2O6_06335 [Ilumatobacteraceae bacterium]
MTRGGWVRMMLAAPLAAALAAACGSDPTSAPAETAEPPSTQPAVAQPTTTVVEVDVPAESTTIAVGPAADLGELEEAIFLASAFPRSVVRPVLTERTVILNGWLFDEAARQDILAAAGVPGVDTVLDRLRLMAPNQQCTEATRAQPNWACLFDATFDGTTIRAEYVGSPDFEGAPWSIDAVHLHFFDDDVPVAGAGAEGAISDGSGTWTEWDDPRTFTATPAEIGSTTSGADTLCVRVADDAHTLVSLDSGNCWPIEATG